MWAPFYDDISLNTYFKCDCCDYQIKVSTPDILFQMTIHAIKEFITRRIIRLHCLIKKHGYYSYLIWERENHESNSK